jgi:hypothetical protein
MLNRIRVLIDKIIEQETPKEDDNEESKINWIIDEFDFRNNNDDLVPGLDLYMSKPKKKRRRKISPNDSESSE